MVTGTARNVTLKVDETRCQVCRTCLAAETCRGNAFLRLDRQESPFIDMSRCWGRFTCIPACPFEAVVRHEYGGENG
jgi:TPP-dependent indolepyruvate ferredoxin oxidoreductase alpha subunit